MSKNKTEFFLDHLLLFLVVEEKTEENKRKTEENKISHFEKRAKFGPKVVPKKERILPKTSKKRRESKQKHKRFASLKISHELCRFRCALNTTAPTTLIIYSSKRD